MNLYLINVFVHVLAVVVWLGGMFFFVLVGAPVLRQIPSAELRARLFAELGRRFRTVGWFAIATLMVSGLLNLHFRGILSPQLLMDSDFWATRYGGTLRIKLVAVMTMLIIQAFHDFIHGPAASTAPQGTPVAARLRRRAALLARLNAILGLIVVFLAIRLARP